MCVCGYNRDRVPPRRINQRQGWHGADALIMYVYTNSTKQRRGFAVFSKRSRLSRIDWFGIDGPGGIVLLGIDGPGGIVGRRSGFELIDAHVLHQRRHNLVDEAAEVAPTGVVFRGEGAGGIVLLGIDGPGGIVARNAGGIVGRIIFDTWLLSNDQLIRQRRHDLVDDAAEVAPLFLDGGVGNGISSGGGGGENTENQEHSSGGGADHHGGYWNILSKLIEVTPRERWSNVAQSYRECAS